MVRTKKETKPVPEPGTEEPAVVGKETNGLVESTTDQPESKAEAPAAVNGEGEAAAAAAGVAVDEQPASADSTTAAPDQPAEAEPEDKKKKKKAPARERKSKGGKKKITTAENGAETAAVDGENKENVEGADADAAAGDGKAEKKKAVKRSIPGWATLSEETKKRMTQNKAVKLARPRLEEEVVNAIKAGSSSAAAIRNYLSSNHPDLPKHLYKMAVKRALDKQLIRQTKGVGFSGSFRLAPVGASGKAAGKKAAAGTAAGAPAKGSLDDLLPQVFTWCCNPKEASYAYIRKYLLANYPELDVEGAAFRRAIESGEEKGQLKRLTGKGAGGTFALVDGADKTGAKYENAIQDAVIAMNEPKDASVTAIRDYLGSYHKEFDTDRRPLVLKKALERCEAKGWIVRITGKGFSGTFRLNYPYHPSPRELWGEEYKERVGERSKSTNKRKAAASTEQDDESDEEEEEDLSDEDEVMPTPKKRAAPVARASAAPARKIPATKKAAAAAAKKARIVAKVVTATKLPVAKKSQPVVTTAKKSKGGRRK